MKKALVTLALLLGASPAVANAAQVDLELLLAIDVSASVDSEEFELQKDGIAEAFRDDLLIDAVMSLPRGQIAVSVMLWSGSTAERPLVVPWTLVSDMGSAETLAASVGMLRRPPVSWLSATGMGNAILQGVTYIGTNEFEGDRQVIDLCSDGKNNDGHPIAAARDSAVDMGVTVNGLAILENEPLLLTYFEDTVIGGMGAFAIPARGYEDFVAAMQSKLFLEIAGLKPSQPLYAVNID